MTWVKLDDKFFSHVKVVKAGRDARDLFIAGLCYCGGNLTDGFIPAGVLRMLAANADIDNPCACAVKLVEVGLWEQVGEDYQVHEYLQYQPAREQVLRERAAAQERMRKLRSGEVRPNIWRSSPEVRHTEGEVDVDPVKTEIQSKTQIKSETLGGVPGDVSPSATPPAPAETEATKKAEKATKQKARKATAKQIKKSTEEQLRAEYGDAAFDKAMEQAVLYTNEYSLPYCRKVLIRWAADYPGHPSPWTLKRATGPPGQPSPNGRQQQGVTRGIAQGNTRKAHDYSAYDDA